MVRLQRLLLPVAAFLSFSISADAQVGTRIGPANTMLSCTATAAGNPPLRPEGYTELVSDIVITCTGGDVKQVGAPILTTNVILYIMPAVPITNRFLGPSSNSGTFASDALLIIDEAGSDTPTGATGGYGPQAPQTLCTTAQQNAPAQLCAAAVGLDQSGQYQVAVLPGTTTPAPNVYQGEVGGFGANSIIFHNVPVFPPAYQGVARTVRITNVRIPVPGGNVNGSVQAILSTAPNQILPVGGSPITVGTVGSSMTASVNTSPVGSGNPFSTCNAITTPTLAARIRFVEGFASSFKTRVVPGGADSAGGNTAWAGQAQNLASPNNQNVPGAMYGGFALNSESAFVLPALTYTDSNTHTTYTAGLADFGTRLKAVFSNIPAGVTVYVSTTSSGSVAVPGGTSVSPYAVLVAASQTGEPTGDGTAFTPLTSTLTGSDGAAVYPLAADNSGVTAAIWEVVDANPSSFDALNFNVYLSYGVNLGTVNPTNVALSYAPEPGGGSFTAVDSTAGVTSPLPRAAVIQAQGGPFATINSCAISITGGTPLNFAYSLGGASPASQVLRVTTVPNNLAVTVTSSVAAPSGGNWLGATLAGGFLNVTVIPNGLPASATAYTGTVKLSAAGQELDVPVTLTVYPTPQYSIGMIHSGNFAQGQNATYSIVVGNASASAPTSGSVTVTLGGVSFSPAGRSFPIPHAASAALSLVSMGGPGWNCNTLPTCTRNDSLPAGGTYQEIAVVVSVAPHATSPQLLGATLDTPGFMELAGFDSAVVTSVACDADGDGSFTAADAKLLLDQALGTHTLANDVNFDGAASVVDMQLIVSAALNRSCVI